MFRSTDQSDRIVAGIAVRVNRLALRRIAEAVAEIPIPTHRADTVVHHFHPRSEIDTSSGCAVKSAIGFG